MKAQVLIDMPENELNDLLVTERDRLVKMKMSHAVSPMENPLQIKFTRKTIARVMTEISKRRNTSK
ncbi:MAG TPA: 50S ribosomal protein L29 [Flavobacteriales bacterium]|nr:50S ribosomal protein L29 [Flavobacteriales bacterium]